MMLVLGTTLLTGAKVLWDQRSRWGDSVTGSKNPDYKIGLNELAKDMVKAGVALPVLVRFPQDPAPQSEQFVPSIDQTIQKYEYQADYLLVYPIKVNQQQTVVEEILASQASKEVPQLGLEAGSKPELMAVSHGAKSQFSHCM